ncbi:hypothetical protein [Gramella sp. AN32]|uniref:Uncharacterized protein n=1 Tax=Christiangramia antarctica TaxID=2058158 RepID=A0ABW5XAY7_9FLAO|nr:hypothetical protein [Gramella sp. AN32]MCM4155309.1 hypothetical protein [Gramella sp. AN32]
MKKSIYIAILFLGLLFTPQFTEAQCAMCRAVLESETDQSTAKGINDGIIYLMIFPYLLIGGVGYFIFKTLRDKKKGS